MIIDCNVSLGHWPFQHTAVQTGRQLERHLLRFGVERALVSSADAVLFPEPGECNVRLRDVLNKANVKKEAIEIAFDGADKGVLPATPDFRRRWISSWGCCSRRWGLFYS